MAIQPRLIRRDRCDDQCRSECRDDELDKAARRKGGAADAGHAKARRLHETGSILDRRGSSWSATPARTRRSAWLRDQYQHPEEHSHTVAEVKQWFAENDVDYLRSFPSTVLDDDSDDLFARAVDDWTIERWIAQLGWMWTLGGEGGLFFTIGARR